MVPRPPAASSWVGMLVFAVSIGLVVYLGERHLTALRRVRRAEAAESRLAAIVTASDNAIISCTLEGVVTSWNPAAERAYGYSAAEIVGRPVSLLVPPDRLGEEATTMARLAAGEHVRVADTTRVARDGRVVHVSMSASPMRDQAGRIIGICRIHHDISSLLDAQREKEELLASERCAREQAERLGRVKDEFVATLSHELRTPLNAILGWSQLVRRPEATPADVAEGLDVIERNARSQTQMIEDLLDVSRIAAGKLRLDVQRVDVAGVVEQAVASARPAADAKGIRLQAVLDPRTSAVNGDPTRLQQIAWNLITNAIKFTPKGGRVQVVVRRQGSSVLIEVCDTGKGIGPESLPRVFERFHQEDAGTTRRSGGLGLGLAIVKHLTELHGGSARVASAGEGKGCTFTIELPLAIAHARPPQRDGTRGGGGGAGGGVGVGGAGADLTGVSILVVDDEPDSRVLIGRILSDRGAKPLLASGVEEALALFRERRPDVLLSDIGMPERDGYDLIRAVRGLPAHLGGSTPAGALSALARTEDRTRALVAGFQVHVAKPVEPSELVAVVAGLARVSFRAPYPSSAPAPNPALSSAPPQPHLSSPSPIPHTTTLPVPLADGAGGGSPPPANS